jgi:hypothetical protein
VGHIDVGTQIHDCDGDGVPDHICDSGEKSSIARSNWGKECASVGKGYASANMQMLMQVRQMLMPVMQVQWQRRQGTLNTFTLCLITLCLINNVWCFRKKEFSLFSLFRLFGGSGYMSLVFF